MLIGGSYYALTLSADGTNSPAYYSVTPTSSLEISQGGVTIEPTGQSTTIVSVYPQTLQIQAPSGTISAGVTIITSESHIAGAVRVSPAVDVPVTIQLWGAGTMLGEYTLPAGQESGAFDFPVSPAESIPASDAQQVLERLIQASA